MSAAYYAPSFRVLINRTSLAADVSKNITDVSVTNQLDAIDTFSLTLANPYPTMRWTHTKDADLFIEGSQIEIEIGYVDNLCSMLAGEITSISPSFPESGAPTVRIDGRSHMHRLRNGQKRRTFQNVTDKEIVEKIAQEVGLTAQVEATSPKHTDVIQDNQTDLAFLRERAGLIDFEVLVEGKYLIFRKVRERQPKTYTLVWGRTKATLDLAQRIVPLQRFDPSRDVRNQVTAVVVRGYNPKTKKEIVARAGIGDEESTMGGKQTGGQLVQQSFGGQREEVCVTCPVASQEEADRQARATYNQRARQFVTGRGVTVGLPDLRAGQVVEILGLGDRFSGAYYVTQTTHTIGGGGYRTTFSVQRSASG